MNRNVEIKAKVTDFAAVRQRAERLSDGGPVLLEQEDTFFVCPQGRLKLRQLHSGAPAELIYYERSDSAQPKESHYQVHWTEDPDGLREALAAALGVRGVVRKRRTLYRVGPTRVHLDEVDGLGEFVELEVVLQPGQNASDGVSIAHDLMDKLGIVRTDLVTGAYIDLIEQDARSGF
jgi:predicted adenylyl cyclase CyaB